MFGALDHLCEVDDSGILVAAKILLAVAEECLTKKVVVVEDLFRRCPEELSAIGDVSLDDDRLIALLQMGV